MNLPDTINLVVDSGVVGVVLPPVAALVNQEHWSARTKGAVTAGLATVAGLATDWTAGDFQGAGWVVSSVTVLLTASAAYAAFWKPTKWADLIESATTFARSKLPKPPAA